MSLAVVVKKFASLAAIAVMTSVGIVVGLLLLIAPGIMLWCAVFVVVPAVVVEDLDAWRAWRRSFDLTEGYRWVMFQLLVFLMFIFFGIGILTASLSRVFAETTHGSMVEMILEVATMLVSIVLFSVAPTVAYHRLRRLKEGMEAADRPSPSGSGSDPALAGTLSS